MTLAPLHPAHTLTNATQRLWDFAIVGAGPAGALAARELARRGASVLLLEKTQFPRYKVRGCCLNPRALRVLRNAGLGHVVKQLGGIDLTHVRMSSRGSHPRVRIPGGMAVSRDAFDTALVHEATQAGASFLPNTTASLPMQAAKDRRVLRLKQGKQEVFAECRVVLAANGLAGKLEEHAQNTAKVWQPGSRVGAGVAVASVPPGYEPHVIYMACGDDGYVGLVQIENGRLDIAAALDPLAVKAAGGTGALAETILAQAGCPAVPGLADLPWKGTPHLTRAAAKLGGERLLVLGDAAGYVEPFTGEGMAWALAGAMTVAPLALQGLDDWNPALVTRWGEDYRRVVKGRQAVCRMTAAILRRPRQTQWMIRALSVVPWAAKPFLRYMYRA